MPKISKLFCKITGLHSQRPSFAIHRLQLLSPSLCRNSTQPEPIQNQALQIRRKTPRAHFKSTCATTKRIQCSDNRHPPSRFPSFCIKRHKIAGKTAPTPAINAQAAFPLSEPPAQCQDTHPSTRLRASPITSSLNTHAMPNGTAECPPHL